MSLDSLTTGGHTSAGSNVSSFCSVSVSLAACGVQVGGSSAVQDSAVLILWPTFCLK